jgi:hypothetical protein
LPLPLPLFRRKPESGSHEVLDPGFRRGDAIWIFQ